MPHTDYVPECWKIVKVTDLSTSVSHKRVLASWYGGYLGSDSWRLSSGCLEPQDCGDHWSVPQTSGSVYRLLKYNEKISGLMQSVFDSYNLHPAKVLKLEWSNV